MNRGRWKPALFICAAWPGSAEAAEQEDAMTSVAITTDKRVAIGTNLRVLKSDIDAGDILNIDWSNHRQHMKVTVLHIERKACTVEMPDGSRWRMTPREEGDRPVVLPTPGVPGQDWVIRYQIQSRPRPAGR
jgi:hypothetical protein